MTDTNTDDSTERIVIDFADTANLNLKTMDIGVADGVIAFDITGTISDVPGNQLDDLQDKELTPTELTLTVADAA